MTDTQAPPRRPSHPVLERLAAAFPVLRECRPLAIGIHKVIKERLPEIDAAQLRAALKSHTASTKYLKAVANGVTRFDLDGNPAGEITAEQRQQALDGLKERFRKGAERKRAEEQQKERQEKLLKLADKFSKR